EDERRGVDADVAGRGVQAAAGGVAAVPARAGGGGPAAAGPAGPAQGDVRVHAPAAVERDVPAPVVDAPAGGRPARTARTARAAVPPPEAADAAARAARAALPADREVVEEEAAGLDGHRPGRGVDAAAERVLPVRAAPAGAGRLARGGGAGAGRPGRPVGPQGRVARHVVVAEVERGAGGQRAAVEDRPAQG